MDNIEYLEIRDINREIIGILDVFQSVIWETDYYGTGSFEVYATASPKNLSLLKIDNYVSRIDDDNIGVIEKIYVEYDDQNGDMIVASGRFGKSLLDRRLIYNISGSVAGKVNILPTTSKGLVEVAARELVNNNIINSIYPARNVDFIILGALQGIDKIIIDEDGDAAEKQTSYGNLLEYTDSMLQEYGLGAYMMFDRLTKELCYTVINGDDRSRNNIVGNNPIIFSQDFDNLLNSSYSRETINLKNTALIGGEGEGSERFCAMIGVNATGLDRREVWVDAKSQSKKYKDESGADKEYTDEEYLSLLKSAGTQQISLLQITEAYQGNVNINNYRYKYRKNFNIGDIVSIEDHKLNIYMNARILKIVECQNEEGYSINLEYGN